jgi:signal peptidase I
MNSVEIGDVVIYNGKIIETENGKYVWRSLYNHMCSGEQYIVRNVMVRNNYKYYLLYFGNTCIWFPKEVFYKKYSKYGMSMLYGLI